VVELALEVMLKTAQPGQRIAVEVAAVVAVAMAAAEMVVVELLYLNSKTHIH
jgi:hypothetical protein